MGGCPSRRQVAATPAGRIPRPDVASPPYAIPNATAHIGWLRATVLSASDGLISTSSLMVGVAAAEGGCGSVLLAAMESWGAARSRWRHRMPPPR